MNNGRTLFNLGAFAVIFDDQRRVLLSHRRDMDAWNLPGGGLEIEELPDECVIREVREETGLEAEVVRLVGVYGKIGRNELVFTFECRVIGGILQPTDESDESRYFVLEDLPSNTLKKHAARILDTISAYQMPVFRKEVIVPRKPSV
jgi:ADP-ribose pyrophosphatase YjhB (NUDIX family)